MYKSKSGQGRLVVIAAVLFGAILSHASPLLAQLMMTSGELEVSGLGGAVYSVPIAVPPGTAGMVPSISLQYNSQGGDGPLGVGWSITGLSEISRCGKTLALDGVISNVAFNSNDRFCLDGQRLVGVSGVYGADGSEYRTEIESFSKIIAHGTAGGATGGPAWWEVRTKAGQIIEYGNTSDSKSTLASIPSVKSWLINKVTDVKGNYLTYTYANNFAYTTHPTREVLPSVISYTGNVAAGLAPYNRIEFVYVQRPDISVLNFAGRDVYRSRRLTNIRTKVGTSIVSDYRLEYDQSPVTGQSRILGVTQCDAAGACLPATSFSWPTRSGRGTFDQTTATYADSPLGAPPRATSYQATGDFNGDGKTDTAFFYNNTIYTFLSQPDGTFQRVTTSHNLGMGSPPQGTSRPVTEDINGDGKTDVVFIYASIIRTFLSNGDGTFQQVSSAAPPAMGNPLLRVALDGDFNRDGKADFALMLTGSIYTFFSNGDGTYQSVSFNPNIAISSVSLLVPGDFNFDGRKDIAFLVNGDSYYALINNGNGTYQSTSGSGASPFFDSTNATTSLVDDLNGDGRTDFAVFINNSVVSWICNGNGTFQATNYNHFLALGDKPSLNFAPAVGDFNGDGRKDMALSGGAKIYTFLSTGNGSFQIVQNSVAALGTPPQAVPLVEDMDGDGKTDVVLFFNNIIKSFLSKGDGTFQLVSTTLNTVLGTPPSASSAPLAGDFNGDGYADMAFFYNTTRYTFLNRIHAPELITQVNIPAFGSATFLNYKPLTDSTVYTKGTGATYPSFDFQAPVFVVSRIASPNGIGGTYSSTYKYEGARLHTTGRGFLGFSSQTVTDSQTGVVQTTNFMQNFPYIGKIASQTKVLNGVTLNSETNTYATGTLPWSGTFFPYLSRRVVESKDLNGTVMPTATSTYTYDTYGNATQIVNSTSDGASQTTNSTYTNNATNWYLGRLSSSTVTNVTP